MYLYIDTSFYLIVGLLNAEFEWVEYNLEKTKKSSQKIHQTIYELLKNNGKDIKDIDAVITTAGPGSYTGIRLAEGMSQVFEWEEVPVYSFYHHEVSQLLGGESGHWFCKAYKNEYFVYSWNNAESSDQLIHKDDIESFLESKENVMTHFVDDEFKVDIELTSNLLHENSEKLFTKVVDGKIKRELYYFRPLEKEFRVSQKD